MLHIIIPLKNCDTTLEGMSIEGMTIKCAFPHSSERMYSSFSSEVLSYDPTDIGTNYIDTSGRRYEKRSQPIILGSNNVFEIIDPINRMGMTCGDVVRNKSDLTKAIGEHVEMSGRIPEFVDGYCYMYISIETDRDEYRVDIRNLLDALRLVKNTSIGYGGVITVDTQSVTGTNIMPLNNGYYGQYITSYEIGRLFKDELVLDEKERRTVWKIYERLKELPEDGFGPFIRTLLSIFRMSFTVDDYRTAMVHQSMIWELYKQMVYGIKSRKHISSNIKKSVSNLLKNNDMGSPFDLIGCLYDIRSKIVHGNCTLDGGAIIHSLTYAFDISRTLILKLLMLDEKIDEFAKKIKNSKKRSKALYPSEYDLIPIDQEMQDLIEEYKRETAEFFKRLKDKELEERKKRRKVNKRRWKRKNKRKKRKDHR